jgi:hypothetical protein
MSDNTTIQIKRSAETGNVPGVGDIDYGELALNYADGIIYYKTTGDEIQSIYLQDVYSYVNVGGTSMSANSVDTALTFQQNNYIQLTADSDTNRIFIGESLSSNVLLLTGGTVYGNVVANNFTTAGVIDVSETNMFSNTRTFTSGSPVVIDSFPTSVYRTVKYLVQVTEASNTSYHSSELVLIHDGSNVFGTEYGVVTTSGELGSFDADINTGLVRLIFTGNNASEKTIKLLRTTIKI